MILNLLISNLFVLFILTYAGNSTLNKRFESKYINITLFFIFYTMMCLNNFEKVNNISAFIVLLLFISYILLVYKDKIFKKLFIIIYIYFIFAVAELFTILIMNVFLDLNETTLMNSLEYSIALICSNLLVLLLTHLFFKVINIFKSFSLPKYTWLIFCLPLSTIILIVSLPNYYDILHNINLVLVLAGLFISNFVCIFIFINSIKSVKLEKELELEKYKQLYSQTKYDLLDNQYKSHFNLLHNLMNECYLMKDYFKNNDYEKAKNEFYKVIDIAFTEFNQLYSNSIIFNTLIANRLDIIKENNLSIKSTIQYNNFNFIDYCDQVDLFSNLLDFTIEESKNSVNPKNILIKSDLIADQVLIQFIFYRSCSEVDDSNFTSCYNILEKYNAILSINNDIDNKTSILLTFPKSK